MKIFFPRGLGGNWLSNLIWHLEHNSLDLPQVDTVFDGQQLSTCVNLSHGVINEIYTPITSKIKLFSSRHLFTHYLNDATKVRYHIHKLHNRPELEQFFDLSNSARYFLSNKEYYNYYCKNIDLDYSKIFQDPDEFITCLFAILNNCNIQYTQNRRYVHESIEYYRSTVTNPEEHYNNPDSIIWLGCCHGVTLTDNLSLAGVITDLRTAQTLLKPYFAYCAERIEPELSKWK